MKKLLAIGPHPDDVEGGMGGTILKFTKLGYEIHILDLTNGEPTPHGNPETRKGEWEKASKLLGVNSRIVLDLPNRYLLDSIEARVKVAEVIRTAKPDIIFLPYWVDAHPDHVQATQIGEAARFYAKLTKTDMVGEPWYPAKVFYYLCYHLRLHVQPSFIIDVSSEFETKLEVLKCYRSQFAYDEERWKLIGGTSRAYAQYYGALIRAQYAEPFVCREEIGLRDIRDIII